VEIIDSHIHMFDIYNGFEPVHPISRLPFGLISLLEWMAFRRAGGGKGATNRFIGDLVFRECCLRVQLCEPSVYLSFFDVNNVSRAIILPIAPNVTTDRILKVCASESRFIPFASVDFHSGDCTQKLVEYMSKGCKGLKIHPVLQRIHPLSNQIYGLLDAYRRYSLPVCFHVGPCRAGIMPIEAESYANPDFIDKLAGDFPDVPFICAHMGLQFYEKVTDLAIDHDNIFLDTSFQPADVLKKADQRVGSSKILFGSDFPLLNQSAVLNVVKRAFRDHRKLERILYQNISELIGL
jgi:uncharacterized protein